MVNHVEKQPVYIVHSLCHTFKKQVGHTKLKTLILAAMYTNLNKIKQLEGASYSEVMKNLNHTYKPSEIVSKAVDLYLEVFEMDSKNALNLLRLLVQLGDPIKIQEFMRTYVTGSEIPGIL